MQQRGNATAVTLLGTSRLIATSINEPKDGPRRVVINLPNVTSAVPKTTNVGQGPVERVRIGFDPKAPLDDAGQHRPVADGALSGRVVAGRQRPDARVRRAGCRSVQRAADDGIRVATVTGHARSRRGTCAPAARRWNPPLAQRLRSAAAAAAAQAARRAGAGDAGSGTAAAGRSSAAALHRQPGQPRLPGRGPARRAENVLARSAG